MYCIPPAQSLQTFVKCYWIFENQNEIADSSQPFPIGSHDLIVNYTDHQVCLEQEEICNHEREAILGTLESAKTNKHKREIGLFAVCFHPNSRQLLSSANSIEVSKEELLNSNFKRLVELLLHAENNEQRVKIANIELQKMVNGTKPLLSRIPIDQVINKIEARKGNISLAALAHKYYCSIGKLEHHFKQRVGIPIKEYCRMVKLKNIILAQRSEYHQQEMGYHNQESFVNDFQQLTGLQPQTLSGIGQESMFDNKINLF